MKRILLIAIPFLLHVAAFCQFRPLDFDPASDGIEFSGIPKTWTSHACVNTRQKKVLITFVTSDRVLYYLVDTTFKILAQYSIARNSLAVDYFGQKYEAVLQTTFDNSVKTYVRKKDGKKIIVEKIDLTTKTSTTYDFLKLNSDEKFLTAFEHNEHNYFLTLVKDVQKLRVYTDSSSNAKEIELHSADGSLQIDLEANLKEILVIRDSKQPELYDCFNPAKLYIQENGQITITLDSNYQFTTIFKINLNEFSCETKFMRKDFSVCNGPHEPESLQTGSFIYRDKILQGVFCKNNLLIQLKNISSGSVIKRFYATSDSAIDFSSSDLMRREKGKKYRVGPLWFIGLGFLDGEISYEKENQSQFTTRDFFKAVKYANFSFLMTSSSGYLVLKIGESHGAEKSGKNSMSYVDGAGYVTTPLRPTMNTFYWTGSGWDFSSQLDQIDTYFTSVMTYDSLELVPESRVNTKCDKIDNVKNKLKEVVFGSVAFDFNHMTYLFYRNVSDLRFEVLRIE